MDLEILLESCESGRRVEVFPMEPVQLLVNVLLWEDKDLKLFRFDQVGALCHLFDEHTQQIASFFQEIIAIVPEALLFGQSWNVEPGKSLHEAVPQGEEMLVSALNLVSIHRCRVNAIDNVNEVISVFLIRDYIEMPGKFI